MTGDVPRIFSFFIVLFMLIFLKGEVFKFLLPFRGFR